MFEFAFVDVKSINSSVPRLTFAESDLENLADIIIETGGLVDPLIVKTTGLESYTVVDGDFEYYAAVRAQEKNPRKCEMVNAFLISSTAEDLIKEQVEIIKNSKSEKIINGEINIAELIEQKLKPVYTRLHEIYVQLNNNLGRAQPDDHLRLLDTKVENLTTLIKQMLPPKSPEKLNLLTATEQEIKNRLQDNKLKSSCIDAAVQAINYWKKTDKGLTWINLKKSTEGVGEHKIKNFGIGTYKKLRELSEID